MSKSLFSVTPDPLTGGGIFSALQSLDPPWVDEDIALQLDMSYYGNISGEKVVSPLIDRILTAEKLSTADMSTLAGILMATNKECWTREWATLSAVYDPINNYDMTEELTEEIEDGYGSTQTRTDNLSHVKTGTETDAQNLTHGKTGTETTTPNLTTNRQQKVNGFNSSSGVNSGSEMETASGSSALQYNLSETDGGQNTTTYNVSDDDTGTSATSHTGSDSHARESTLHRSGNIGVTTTQQLLQSERDLWIWNFFRDVVFPDVDKVLTIQTY